MYVKVKVFSFQCLLQTVAPVPEEDLPDDVVVQPNEYPDWGEENPAPAQPDCESVDVPQVRYASSTK